MSSLKKISNAVEEGKVKKIGGIVQEALDEGVDVIDILNCMIDAMAIVGEQFKNSEIFVPEMLVSAHTMKKGVEIIKPQLSDISDTSIGKCIIGTVTGDLHDIGKNLVAMMIESTGFEVIDLGVDVSKEKFIDTINANDDCKIVALSSLLTTTMPAMKESVGAIIEAGLKEKVKILIGGAPITEEYANEIGADGFAQDAASAAQLAKSLVGPMLSIEV